MAENGGLCFENSQKDWVTLHFAFCIIRRKEPTNLSHGPRRCHRRRYEVAGILGAYFWQWDVDERYDSITPAALNLSSVSRRSVDDNHTANLMFDKDPEV